MSEPTVFTKIINRELPAYIAYEDDDHIVFASIEPRADGHLLVVPKTPYRWFLDMPSEAFAELMTTAQSIAQRLQAATDAERIEVGIDGQHVPHVHVHLIPRFSDDDIEAQKDFDEAKTKQIIAKL